MIVSLLILVFFVIIIFGVGIYLYKESGSIKTPKAMNIIEKSTLIILCVLTIATILHLSITKSYFDIFLVSVLLATILTNLFIRYRL